MKTFIAPLVFLGTALLLNSCYQIRSEEGTLRTVPVTNNPYLVPSGGEMTTFSDAMKSISTP